MKRASELDATESPEYCVDQLCDAYESAWQRGARPQIRTFLEQGDPAYGARLFRELLLVELEYRRNQGECPTLDEYRRDFPDFAEEIEGVHLENGTAAFGAIVRTDDDTVRVRKHTGGER